MAAYSRSLWWPLQETFLDAVAPGGFDSKATSSTCSLRPSTSFNSNNFSCLRPSFSVDLCLKDFFFLLLMFLDVQVGFLSWSAGNIDLKSLGDQGKACVLVFLSTVGVVGRCALVVVGQERWSRLEYEPLVLRLSF